MTTTPTAQGSAKDLAHAFDDAEEHDRGKPPAVAFRAGVRAGRYPVIPDAVQQALDAREHLTELQAHLYDDAPPRSGAARSLLDALVHGEDVSAALQAAVDGQQDLDRREIAANLLRLALGGAETFLREQITAALPEILGGLREQLGATVGKLRAAYTAAGDLDVNQPDPMLVAQATDEQRAALVTVAEETRVYRRIRTAQRDALTASSLPIPGDDGFRIVSWAEFFKSGVHEVSAPGGYGLPGEGQAPRTAVRTVVSRPDVWLPDPDDMLAAHGELETILRAQRAEDREAAARRAAKLAEDSRLGTFSGPAAAVLDARTSNRGGAQR